MTTIYKYPIQITDSQELNLPKGAEILSVGLDPNLTPCLWAKVDDKQQSLSFCLLRELGTLFWQEQQSI